MSDHNARSELKTTLAGFDERQKKVIGGMLAVMIEHPNSVQDREWISEQLTQITLLTADFEHLEDVMQGVTEVQAYLRAHAEVFISVCFQLFQFTAEDLAPRVARGITREEALAHALGYFTR